LIPVKRCPRTFQRNLITILGRRVHLVGGVLPLPRPIALVLLLGLLHRRGVGREERMVVVVM
jgi:hypothetical protein